MRLWLCSILTQLKSPFHQSILILMWHTSTELLPTVLGLILELTLTSTLLICHLLKTSVLNVSFLFVIKYKLLVLVPRPRIPPPLPARVANTISNEKFHRHWCPHFSLIRTVLRQHSHISNSCTLDHPGSDHPELLSARPKSFWSMPVWFADLTLGWPNFQSLILSWFCCHDGFDQSDVRHLGPRFANNSASFCHRPLHLIRDQLIAALTIPGGYYLGPIFF